MDRNDCFGAPLAAVVNGAAQTVVLETAMTIQCPKCKLQMPWTPQPTRVAVRCVNREITSWIGDPPRPQLAYAIYATTDRSICWGENYWVDGPDRLPNWRCGAVFAVRAS